jgi:hypothetical protein
LLNPGDEDPPRDVTHDLELWLVQAIEQVPGVLGAAVWLSDLKRVRALHITAAPTASGIIVANAASQILRRHNLQFTPDMIRVAFRDAQEGLAEVAAPLARSAVPTGGGRFLVLEDMNITRAGSRVVVHVVVGRGEDRLEGEASELDTEAGRARAAARATLSAAERAGERLALGLEGALQLDMYGRRYVAVSVEAAVDRRFALLAGLVPIDAQRSLEEAACLAALHAIDRWIAW